VKHNKGGKKMINIKSWEKENVEKTKKYKEELDQLKKDLEVEQNPKIKKMMKDAIKSTSKSIDDIEYELNVLKKRRKQLTGMIIERQTGYDQLKDDLELVQNDISKQAIKYTMESIAKEINIIKNELEALRGEE